MKKKTTSTESGAKAVIYCRIDPASIVGLDKIRDEMRPKPSRAQLIDAAVAEYVERHGKSDKHRDTK